MREEEGEDERERLIARWTEGKTFLFLFCATVNKAEILTSLNPSSTPLHVRLIYE